jgi:competence protein ComEC
MRGPAAQAATAAADGGWAQPTARERAFGGSHLLAYAIGFAAGVFSLYLLSDLPPLTPLLAATVALAAVALRWPWLRPLAFAGLGLVWAQLDACGTLCHPLPESLAGKPLSVTGVIETLPVATSMARRFVFRAEAARKGRKDLEFRGRARLSWYGNPPDLTVGERWQLRVVLKPPHGFANPGGFDYERWLFQQGLKATGHVRDAAENQRIAASSDAIGRWRQQLRDHLERSLAQSPARGLVEALVLGERSAVTPDQWEALIRTGTNHLVAISGLHVGLVSAFVFLLARWLWSRSASLTLLMAAPRLAALVAIMSAFAYSALAGFAVSTQRAVVMCAVVLGAVVFSRTLRPATGLAVALGAVLVLDPRAVLAYGFWLSFSAVAVLLFALGRRPLAGGWWGRWGRAQWAIALGLLPLLLLLFGRASLIAPLVNLIAVPLFGVLVLPLVLVTTLLSLVPGLELPLALTARALAGGLELLQAVAVWPWTTATVSGHALWVWALVFVGALLLLAPRGLPGRWLGLLLLLPLSLVRPPMPAVGEAEFTLLDVGQGLSAVVHTRQHTLVYDTGPAYPSGFNTGSAVVMPFLREAGISRIDTLVLTHGDRDHVGGFAGIKGSIPIGRILSGEPERVPRAEAEPCVAGQSWVWDGVRFDMLHPSAAAALDGGNESSCVLRVASAAGSVLLTGDIGFPSEEELVASDRRRLASTILVAAHHGSAHSTSATFLDAVEPSYVLYATGYANRFGFPTAEVRARVAGRGAVELDTARAGAILFRLGRRALDGPRLYREEHRHLWSR